jgi:hypothetical protein
VSPRRNHRRHDAPDLDQEVARRGVESTQSFHGRDWVVRGIAGGAAAKTYRCPGCDQEVPPGVAHVVAWPADGGGGPQDRRHWHTGCWRARDRRTPRIERSRNAPRG